MIICDVNTVLTTYEGQAKQICWDSSLSDALSILYVQPLAVLKNITLMHKSAIS